MNAWADRGPTKGFTVAFDEAFPGAGFRNWFTGSAEDNGWKRLAYRLDGPDYQCCAGSGWMTFGQEPVGLWWDCWWVNDQREALSLYVQYFADQIGRGEGGTAMIRYFPSGRYLDALVKRYEAARGKIWQTDGQLPPTESAGDSASRPAR